MLSEEEIKEVEKAKSNILRGNDIESAALILEKVIWGNLIIVGGRVNITKVAVRQILNFIEEYKDKGYLDVVREKVKANEERTKLQKEVEHQKEKRENQKTELAILNEKQKEMNKLINTVKSYKGQFKRQEKEIKQLQKGNEEKDKQIDLMAEMIDELSEYYARYWGKNNEFCKEECIKKDIDCKDCIKQYFEKLEKEKGE